MPFYKHNNYVWEGIPKVDYKPCDPGQPQTFSATDRQTLVGPGNDTAFHLRYFECAVGGYSSLEKHQHVHVVVCMRGHGTVVVDNEVYQVEPYDLVVIPPWAKHQLINTSDTEPFGFFCTVDGARDRYAALTHAEVDEMCKDPAVKAALRIHEHYWG